MQIGRQGGGAEPARAWRPAKAWKRDLTSGRAARGRRGSLAPIVFGAFPDRPHGEQLSRAKSGNRPVGERHKDAVRVVYLNLEDIDGGAVDVHFDTRFQRHFVKRTAQLVC